MNPRDFFTLALTLAQSGSSAEMRTAISRPARGMVLITRNLSDFGKVPDLKIEDWTEL